MHSTAENPHGPSNFARFLYGKLISPGSRDWPVDRVARRLGLSPSTIYAYCEGRRRAEADLIPALYAVTGDRDYLAWSLEDTPFVLAERPDGRASHGDVRDLELDLVTRTAHYLESIQTALEDGRIEARELRGIRELHAVLVGRLASLDATLLVMESKQRVGERP